jgi:hypothetical protein
VLYNKTYLHVYTITCKPFSIPSPCYVLFLLSCTLHIFLILPVLQGLLMELEDGAAGRIGSLHSVTCYLYEYLPGVLMSLSECVTLGTRRLFLRQRVCKYHQIAVQALYIPACRGTNVYGDLVKLLAFNS